MTAKEEKTLTELTELMKAIREENRMFRDSVNSIVNELSEQVEKKHMPIRLEEQIQNEAAQAIGKAIVSTISSYNSPLHRLSEMVVNKHSKALETLAMDCMQKAVEENVMKEQMTAVFSKLVAKQIVNSSSGLIDKVSKDLKSNPIFIAKMIAATAAVVEELAKTPEAPQENYE